MVQCEACGFLSQGEQEEEVGFSQTLLLLYLYVHSKINDVN